MVPIDTTHLMQWLASGAGIMVAIQGLKNLLPGVFDKSPKIAIIIAGVGALVTGLVPCVSGKGIDIGCAVNALMTFLVAIGAYHSVSQAGGGVKPPLPPQP